MTSAELQYKNQLGLWLGLSDDNYRFGVDFRKNLTSKFGDLEGIRLNFKEFFTMVNENDRYEYPWKKEDFFYILSDQKPPLLSLYCDQKNVISISIYKAIEDNSETVMVENGAECFSEIENNRL